MMSFNFLFVFCMTVAFSVPIVGYSEALTSSSMTIAKNDAKKKKRSKKKSAPEKESNSGDKKVRERFITRSAEASKDKKDIDFDAIDIAGERKNPFGSLINQKKSRNEFDLIKIRYDWKPEMVQSTSSIESGR